MNVENTATNGVLSAQKAITELEIIVQITAAFSTISIIFIFIISLIQILHHFDLKDKIINNKMKQILMKHKDIKKLKEKIWKQNDGKCSLLGVEVSFDKMVLDHIHKLKSEDANSNKGAVRGALEFRANAMEGKITNNWKRYFGADETKHPIDLPTFLRNLANYLEQGCYHDNNEYFIHPSEVPKAPLLKKSVYNVLKKCYTGKAKFPNYPKSKKLTAPLRKLFKLYNIEPKFYK